MSTVFRVAAGILGFISCIVLVKFWHVFLQVTLLFDSEILRPSTKETERASAVRCRLRLALLSWPVHAREKK